MSTKLASATADADQFPGGNEDAALMDQNVVSKVFELCKT